jgi:hypothetical protein
VDYLEFPEEAGDGKSRPPASLVAARADMGSAGRYASENAYQRASAEAGIACRVCSQLELVATSLAKA